MYHVQERGETEQERPRRIADRHVKIVTSKKMSYAQVKERVVKDSPEANVREEAMDLDIEF
jgi:hypothetical protein